MPKPTTNFRDFYNDDTNVSPAERAKIEFEVELIGKLIEVRESKGLTQAQLAEAAGLKQSAVARLESMKATPQIDTLFKVLTPMGYKLAIIPNLEDEYNLKIVKEYEAEKAKGNMKYYSLAEVKNEFGLDE